MHGARRAKMNAFSLAPWTSRRKCVIAFLEILAEVLRGEHGQKDICSAGLVGVGIMERRQSGFLHMGSAF